jgi:hypothetical protein
MSRFIFSPLPDFCQRAEVKATPPQSPWKCTIPIVKFKARSWLAHRKIAGIDFDCRQIRVAVS